MGVKIGGVEDCCMDAVSMHATGGTEYRGDLCFRFEHHPSFVLYFFFFFGSLEVQNNHVI